MVSLNEHECCSLTWVTDVMVGVVGAELRTRQQSKILSLASMHV